VDNIKSQEIELMHQKIKDFELILDENQNEHIESIKNLRNELDQYKNNSFENEKFFDILNYFFKKLQIYYSGSNSHSAVEVNIEKEVNTEKKKEYFIIILI
jgi:hypothetical protein